MEIAVDRMFKAYAETTGISLTLAQVGVSQGIHAHACILFLSFVSALL